MAAADIAIRKAKHAGAADISSTAIEQALSEADLAAILEMALQHVANSEPRLIAAIRDGTLASVYRTPIGEQLSLAG